LIPDEVRRAVQAHPYPLLFATVSGAHLYGFPSIDSDWDLRGAHILPAENVLGLLPVEDTVELSSKEGVELDIVSHDVRKFFSLLLKANGYVLEQLYSPIIVLTSPEHEELKSISRGCITRFHVHHYLGFAANQWKLFLKDEPHRVKPLLYVFRVLLTGIHLMETGEVEANLCVLNDHFRIPFIPDLIARKTGGVEQQVLGSEEMEYFERQFTEWEMRLMEAGEKTHLPSENSAKVALNDLLVRLRLRSIRQSTCNQADPRS
jgi:predicted nucleotidyltransferase